MKYRVHEIMEIESPKVRRLSIQIEQVPDKIPSAPGVRTSVGAIVEVKRACNAVEVVDFGVQLDCRLSRDQWEAAKAAVDAAWAQWDTIEAAERIVKGAP